MKPDRLKKIFAETLVTSAVKDEPKAQSPRVPRRNRGTTQLHEIANPEQLSYDIEPISTWDLYQFPKKVPFKLFWERPIAFYFKDCALLPIFILSNPICTDMKMNNLCLLISAITLNIVFSYASSAQDSPLKSVPSGISENLELNSSYTRIRIGEPMLNGEASADDVIGRWNLILDMNGKEAPSWLEVKLSGFKVLVGHFVGDDGSARPISEVHYDNGKISFSIPPQWQVSDKNLVFEGQFENGMLTGTIQHPSGGVYPFVGKRAPSLVRDQQPRWGQPIALFNGKDLGGWYADKPENQWEVKNGVLTSAKSGANLISDEKFEDFQLNVVFRYPEGSNSGIFLRGRYEVQIQDDMGKAPNSLLFGGIYGFLTPNEMVALKAGEWQTFHITLVGRRITVVANGRTIIADQIIPGITGGALDSREDEPGPLMLQGDHGPIEFQKIELVRGIMD